MPATHHSADFIASNDARTRLRYQQPAAPAAACLQGVQHCEVIVVGGGLAGLSSALHLAQRGVRVGLLEARRLAWAASGRNGGHVLNAFACDLDDLRAQVGLEHSRRLWDLAEAAVRWVDGWASARPECELARGSLYVAVKPKQIAALRALQHESEQLYHYAGLRWLERASLPAYLHSPRYCAGLYDAHSLHLNPWRLSQSLATAATAAGAQLYEHSPALTWEVASHAGQRGFRVRSPEGELWAEQLLLCANTGLAQLVPELGAHTLTLYSYQGMTPVLGAARASALIPAHCAVSDTNTILDYYRRSADHRLIFGGLVGFSPRPPLCLKARLQRRLWRVFPQLQGTALEQLWSGAIDLSHHRAPHFGRLASGAYFVHGFSGHGVALACLSGRLLSQALHGDTEDFDCFAQIPALAYHGPAWWQRMRAMASLIRAQWNEF